MATKVLSGIQGPTLASMLKHEQIIFDEATKKGTLLNILNEEVEAIGINALTSSLKAQTLKSIVVDTLGIPLGENNGSSKVVMARRLSEAMKEHGLSKFLSSTQEELKEKDLLAMAQVLGGSSNSKTSLKDVISEIENLVLAAGLEIFLSRFEVPLLQQVCSEVGLKCNTNSVNEIILAIVQHRNALSQPIPEKKIVISKTKPNIEEGISKDDLFSWYTHAELFEFCSENGIKTSGTKSKLIERILNFLSGNKENIMHGDVKKTKRKVSEETKKRRQKEKERQKKENAESKKSQQPDEEDEEKPAPKKTSKPTKEKGAKSVETKTEQIEEKSPKKTAKNPSKEEKNAKKTKSSKEDSH